MTQKQMSKRLSESRLDNGARQHISQQGLEKLRQRFHIWTTKTVAVRHSSRDVWMEVAVSRNQDTDTGYAAL